MISVIVLENFIIFGEVACGIKDQTAVLGVVMTLEAVCTMAVAKLVIVRIVGDAVELNIPTVECARGGIRDLILLALCPDIRNSSFVLRPCFGRFIIIERKRDLCGFAVADRVITIDPSSVIRQIRRDRNFDIEEIAPVRTLCRFGAGNAIGIRIFAQPGLPLIARSVAYAGNALEVEAVAANCDIVLFGKGGLLGLGYFPHGSVGGISCYGCSDSRIPAGEDVAGAGGSTVESGRCGAGQQIAVNLIGKNLFILHAVGVGHGVFFLFPHGGVGGISCYGCSDSRFPSDEFIAGAGGGATERGSLLAGFLIRDLIRKDDLTIHTVGVGDGVLLFAANVEGNAIASHYSPCAIPVHQLDGLGVVVKKRMYPIVDIVLFHILIRCDGDGVGVVVNLLKSVISVVQLIGFSEMICYRVALYLYQQPAQDILTGRVGRGR